MKNIVEVEVLAIKPSGICVRLLSSNEVGVIRRRELSWDRRFSTMPPIPGIGQKLKVVLLKDKSGLFFSLRRMINPWQDTEERFNKMQVVYGEVVNVRHFAAFVQIEPGIDAVVWPREMPLQDGQLPIDILSIGDRVQGVITKLDSKEQKIEISLIKHLESLDPRPKRRKRQQIKFFTNERNDEAKNIPTTPVESNCNTPRLSRYYPPIAEPKKLLVIDDDEQCLQDICACLESKYDFKIDCVRSGQQALDKLQEQLDYDILVIDISLKNECGIVVAKQLLDLKPDLAIIFTSANLFIEDKKLTIRGRKWPFAFKDSEEIADWIEKLCHGYREIISEMAEPAEKEQAAFIRQLGMSTFSRRSLPDRLHEILAKLKEEIGVSQAIIVEIDSINKQVSFLAANPPLDDEIQYYTLDGLYYSPVREVIEEGTEFYATHINQDTSSRFKNFFQLIAYQTTFGIPIKIPDLISRHGLFVFDENNPTFNEEQRNKVRIACQLIQVTLERALLFGYMRRYEQRYTLGQLLGSLVHELHNKLDGLSGSALTLSVILEHASHSMSVEDYSSDINSAITIAKQITQAKNELGELIRSYSRLASGKLEAVDVNNALYKIQRQMKYKAHEANVEIDLDLQSNLPPGRAIESRFMQIISNIVLNAIQQIEAQAKRMKRIAQEEGHHDALLQSGLIIIQSEYNGDSDSSYPIRINVLDTGPGVHYEQQESIFLLDTSTRQKGQGLGLYISRNLAETMGGRLHLADSIMFIGSRFTVELPQY